MLYYIIYNGISLHSREVWGEEGHSQKLKSRCSMTYISRKAGRRRHIVVVVLLEELACSRLRLCPPSFPSFPLMKAMKRSWELEAPSKLLQRVRRRNSGALTTTTTVLVETPISSWKEELSFTSRSTRQWWTYEKSHPQLFPAWTHFKLLSKLWEEEEKKKLSASSIGHRASMYLFCCVANC